MSNRNRPLITVGLPTYNRPDKLRRALRSIVQQTYTNLEILVSDNNSPGTSTERVLEEFSDDKRIAFTKHSSNAGPSANFRYVIDHASGDYFMLQADDDFRSADCIEMYLSAIGSSGGAFASYSLFDWLTEASLPGIVPELSGEAGSRSDLRQFFATLCPSMVYGLFKTDVMQLYWPRQMFDWSDVLFLLQTIKHVGIVTKTSSATYFCGVDGAYEPKPFDGKRMRPWQYWRKALPFALYAGPTATIWHLRAARGMALLAAEHRRRADATSLPFN